jgi:hypothetical protein
MCDFHHKFTHIPERRMNVSVLIGTEISPGRC